MIKLSFLTIFFSLLAFSQTEKTKLTQEELKGEIIDYSSIKSVLKNDNLLRESKLKEKVIREIKKERTKIEIKKYIYPSENDFWSFISTSWLVLNAQKLKWDSPRPDYGVAPVIKELLEKFGYYNTKFKILVIDNPSVYHMMLPSKKSELLFIISLPFMRSLDLTKVDIALLFFEGMIRDQNSIFKNKIKADKTFIGQQFTSNKYNPKLIKDILNEYNRIVFQSGFSFQEQFDTTKAVDSILKSEPKLWNTYYKMILKIDELLKNNLLFKDYSKIYPSPEMQLKWLVPNNKK